MHHALRPLPRGCEPTSSGHQRGSCLLPVCSNITPLNKDKEDAELGRPVLGTTAAPPHQANDIQGHPEGCLVHVNGSLWTQQLQPANQLVDATQHNRELLFDVLQGIGETHRPAQACRDGRPAAAGWRTGQSVTPAHSFTPATTRRSLLLLLSSACLPASYTGVQFGERL